MRTGKLLRLILMVGVAAEAVASESLVERLLGESAKIQTIRCDIRRDLAVEGSRTTTLSRIWFERPDRLRVDTVIPDARRIVVDGTTIYKWVEGMQEGVFIPLSEAPESDLTQVRKTPGKVDEHLQQLRGLAELELPPSDGFPIRRAYIPPAPHPYTVLSLDKTGRLARLEFFDALNREKLLLRSDFEGWREAQSGIWIACIQKTETKVNDGTSVKETLRVSALAVNTPIMAENFDIEKQGAGVRFLSRDEMETVLRNQK